MEIAGESATYSPARFGNAAVNDEIGGEAIVVFSRDDGTAAAYLASIDGRVLTFAHEDGGYIDAETGSEWDFAGRAVSGEMAGQSLAATPSRSTFWFAYVAIFPETRVVLPPPGTDP